MPCAVTALCRGIANTPFSENRHLVDKLISNGE